MMHPVRQFLLHQYTASTTQFAGISWVNKYYSSASLFRFTRSELYQLIPSSIRDAFCKAMVFNHCQNVQVFKGDNSKLINKPSAQFVSKVFSVPSDAFVYSRNWLASFRSLWRSFFLFTQLALYFNKFFFPQS